MTTQENLAAAFAGESQANRKYLAFAKKADVDGLPQLAKLFRATAEAETIHAHAHLKAMGGIKSSVENLKAAIEGEATNSRRCIRNFWNRQERTRTRKRIFLLPTPWPWKRFTTGCMKKPWQRWKEARICRMRKFMCVRSAGILWKDRCRIIARCVAYPARSS